MPKQLRRARPGDPITAAGYNELVDAVNMLGEVSGSYPIEVRRQPSGVQIGLARLPHLWLFQIANSNPTTVSGLRYWDAARIRPAPSGAYAAATPTGVRLFDPLFDKTQEMIHLQGEWLWAAFNEDSGRWEVVNFDALTRRGKLDGTLAVGGSAVVSIWRFDGSAEVDSGENVTAFDWLMKAGAPAIAANKKVIVTYFPESGRWYVTEAECP